MNPTQMTRILMRTIGIKKPVVNGKAAPVQKIEESKDDSNCEDEKPPA